MSFSDHIFYENINFDVNKKMYRGIAVKQGDTGSRGFFVKVIQNSEVIDISDKTMTFYCEKPDKTRVYIDAVRDGDRFRVDLTNQVFAVPGTVECELTLKGPDDEIISDKTFSITVEPSLQYGSMLSQSELSDFGRHLADYTAYIASELSEEHIPRALPNGVKDEIDLATGKLIKRIKTIKVTSDLIASIDVGENITRVMVNKPQDSLTYNNQSTSHGIVTIEGLAEDLEGQLTDDVTKEWLFNTRNIAARIRIGLPLHINTLEKAGEQLAGRTLTYQLAEPEIIDLPEVMSPNTRTLMHLIERLQKLEEYIST